MIIHLMEVEKPDFLYIYLLVNREAIIVGLITTTKSFFAKW